MSEERSEDFRPAGETMVERAPVAEPAPVAETTPPKETTSATGANSTPAAEGAPEGDALTAMILRARKAPEDVAALIKTRKEILNIPILKTPAKTKYWRAREGEEWSYSHNSYLLLPPDFGGDRREFMLVAPALEEFVRSKKQLEKAVKLFGLAAIVDVHGSPAFWALNLADTGAWGTSARAIVEEMKTDWAMVCAETDRYVCVRPEDDLGEPTWPPGEPMDWLKKAFDGRIIDSEDHPEIKKLLGKK